MKDDDYCWEAVYGFISWHNFTTKVETAIASVFVDTSQVKSLIFFADMKRRKLASHNKESMFASLP